MTLTKNNLKLYRIKNELSQEKLASQLKVTRQTIISIEGGKYIPSLPLALKISKIFKIKVENIFDIE